MLVQHYNLHTPPTTKRLPTLTLENSSWWGLKVWGGGLDSQKNNTKKRCTSHAWAPKDCTLGSHIVFQVLWDDSQAPAVHHNPHQYASTSSQAKPAAFRGPIEGLLRSPTNRKDLGTTTCGRRKGTSKLTSKFQSCQIRPHYHTQHKRFILLYFWHIRLVQQGPKPTIVEPV